MNRSMFKSVNRAQDLENRILLARSMAEERGTPVDSILAIQGVELPNCKYLMSTQKDGFILNNYFEWTEHSPFVGLAYAPVGSDHIQVITTDEYCKFLVLHDEAWLLLTKDSTYRLCVNRHIYEDSVVSYDILRIGADMFFVQLDYVGYRSLLCLLRDVAHQGYFAPQSLDHFDLWFSQQMARKGYEGKLDGINISEFYQLYYEVRNCIFVSAPFKPLKLVEESQVCSD